MEMHRKCCGLTLEDYFEAIRPLYNPTARKKLAFTKVIFNGPATIVFWDDGTKTVVKCKDGDPFSKEAGFALCVLKKLRGDRFHRVLRNGCKED